MASILKVGGIISATVLEGCTVIVIDGAEELQHRSVENRSVDRQRGRDALPDSRVQTAFPCIEVGVDEVI